MNQEEIINKLAYVTGKSRKQVMDVLKQMSGMPDVKKELRKMKRKREK